MLIYVAKLRSDHSYFIWNWRAWGKFALIFLYTKAFLIHAINVSGVIAVLSVPSFFCRRFWRYFRRNAINRAVYTQIIAIERKLLIQSLSVNNNDHFTVISQNHKFKGKSFQKALEKWNLFTNFYSKFNLNYLFFRCIPIDILW